MCWKVIFSQNISTHKSDFEMQCSKLKVRFDAASLKPSNEPVSSSLDATCCGRHEAEVVALKLPLW